MKLAATVSTRPARAGSSMRGLAIIYRPRRLWKFSGSERRFVNVSKYLKSNHAVTFDSIETYPPLNLFLQTYHESHSVNLSNNLYMNLIEWLTMGTASILKLRKRQYAFVYATNINLHNVLLGIVGSKLVSLPLIVVVHHLRWVHYTDSETLHSFSLKEVYSFMRGQGLNSLASLVRAGGGVYAENPLLKRADAFITVSDTVGSQLRQLGHKTEIFLNGNAIGERFLECQPKGCPKRYDAIYVGRLDEGKGAFDLLRVWGEIVQSLHEAKLIIVGTGTLYHKVKYLIEKKGLRHCIKLAGFVRERDLLSLLLSSKVFVTLSTTEGWGLAMGEAVACGLPVVCYEIPSLREVYDSCDSVRLVEIGNTRKAADEIIKLLEEGGSPSENPGHLRAFIRRFSWKEVARKEHVAIESVVEKGE
jgi:glycosyltransferase involved in cell wall biosynthesis